MLDLDDMAIGPAEFDIANFAAHFVTSRRFYVGDVLDGFLAVVGLKLGDRQDLHACMDERRLHLCGSASLLRRCLKLAERHESETTLLAWLEAARRLMN